MIKFLEFKQSDVNDGELFVDGLNHFLDANVAETDSILSVKYKRYIENNNPASSVFIVINTDSRDANKIGKTKRLYFFELNEHDYIEGMTDGRDFSDILNDDFGSILQPEDDILAIEYDKYFYQGKSYSSVLLLMNVLL